VGTPWPQLADWEGHPRHVFYSSLVYDFSVWLPPGHRNPSDNLLFESRGFSIGLINSPARIFALIKFIKKTKNRLFRGLNAIPRVDPTIMQL